MFARTGTWGLAGALSVALSTGLRTDAGIPRFMPVCGVAVLWLLAARSRLETVGHRGRPPWC